MIFVCSPHNDLYLTLKNSGYSYPRFDILTEALYQAGADSAVLALADEYPKPWNVIEKSVLDEAEAKSPRLYIEYPEKLPGMETGRPRPADCERAIVSSDFFWPLFAQGENTWHARF